MRCALIVLAMDGGTLSAQAPASVHWGLAGNGSVTTTSGWIFGLDEAAQSLTVGYDGTYTGAFSAYQNIQKLKPSDNCS